MYLKHISILYLSITENEQSHENVTKVPNLSQNWQLVFPCAYVANTRKEINILSKGSLSFT